jgi:hypothetical protein
MSGWKMLPDRLRQVRRDAAFAEAGLWRAFASGDHCNNQVMGMIDDLEDALAETEVTQRAEVLRALGQRL